MNIRAFLAIVLGFGFMWFIWTNLPSSKKDREAEFAELRQQVERVVEAEAQGVEIPTNLLTSLGTISLSPRAYLTGDRLHVYAANDGRVLVCVIETDSDMSLPRVIVVRKEVQDTEVEGAKES